MIGQLFLVLGFSLMVTYIKIAVPNSGSCLTTSILSHIVEIAMKINHCARFAKISVT